MTSGGYYVATHILTVWKRLAGLEPDQPHGWSFPDVAGSKTHKLLTKKSKEYVVEPEWVLDSVAIGKRQSEQTYAIVKHSNTLSNVWKVEQIVYLYSHP